MTARLLSASSGAKALAPRRFAPLFDANAGPSNFPLKSSSCGSQGASAALLPRRDLPWWLYIERKSLSRVTKAAL